VTLDGTEAGTYSVQVVNGQWGNNTGNYGEYINNGQNTTDYLEITFYGTGLNLLIIYNGDLTCWKN
jgi:hypothetical protein